MLKRRNSRFFFENVQRGNLVGCQIGFAWAAGGTLPRWIGFSEADGSPSRRRREFQAAESRSIYQRVENNAFHLGLAPALRAKARAVKHLSYSPILRFTVSPIRGIRAWAADAG